MRNLRFRLLLAVAIAGLALLAVAGMSSVAYGLLRRLARQEAIERATLASAAGAEAVARAANDLTRNVDALSRTLAAPFSGTSTPGAATPAEHRYSEDRRNGTTSAEESSSASGPSALARAGAWTSSTEAPSPRSPLEDARRTGNLASCGLLRPGAPPLLDDPAGTSDGWSLPSAPGLTIRRDARGEFFLLAARPLVGATGGLAWCAHALLPASLAPEALHPSTMLALLQRGAEPPEGPARARLRETAFQSGAVAAGELAADRLIVAVRPLPPPLDALAVEAIVPSGATEAALVGLRERLSSFAVIVAAVAALCGLALGQWLATPIARLTAAAGRLGSGDLETPVDRPGGAELGRLAEALDAMRARLRRQTADLRRQQAESDAVLGGIAEGVFTVDRERRIRYVNPQLAAALGREPAALVGAFCGDVLRPAAEGGTRPCEERCPIVHARSRGTASAVEHLELPDGARRTVVITSSPPSDGLQFQVLRDETESEAARRLRDAVLANLSHEFKTPLSAQLASLELLAERVHGLNDAPAEELVAALERGTLRLTQLVDNLLESARLEAGHAAIRRRPVRLDEIVEEAVELTAPLFRQREQGVDVDLPYPLPDVLGDAPRLVQVFVNLLANANKFAPAGSRVVLAGDVGAERVGVWVEDGGPGLPDIAGRSLFGRFVRSAGDDEPEQSGMGLGLWIAQSIVERHGGTIDALRLGERTRVVVRLPRAPAVASPDGEAS